MMPGQTFVWGKDRATARALLDAAAELGLDAHVVATKHNGFVVPDAVADLARPAIVAGDDEAPATDTDTADDQQF